MIPATNPVFIIQQKARFAYFLLSRIIRAILEPKDIKHPRKCPFYQHFRGFVRYSNSSFRFVRTFMKCIINSLYVHFMIEYPHNPIRSQCFCSQNVATIFIHLTGTYLPHQIFMPHSEFFLLLPALTLHQCRSTIIHPALDFLPLLSPLIGPFVPFQPAEYFFPVSVNLPALYHLFFQWLLALLSQPYNEQLLPPLHQ